MLHKILLNKYTVGEDKDKLLCYEFFINIHLYLLNRHLSLVMGKFQFRNWFQRNFGTSPSLLILNTYISLFRSKLSLLIHFSRTSISSVISDIAVTKIIYMMTCFIIPKK